MEKPSRVPVAPNLGYLPPDGSPYPLILRGPSYAWWRSLLGALFGLSLYVVLTAAVSQIVTGLGWVVAGRVSSYADYASRALAFQEPSGMLGANLGIATLIPISWIMMAVVHQVRPRWLSSVQPRIRWRYLLICLPVALAALNGLVLISTLFGASLSFAPQAGVWGFLVVIVLTSPLQAIAEEVFFRGYLLQALGSLVSRPWFGVVVSALVFAFLHGTQNLPLFLNRLAFGILAAALVWRTGGLEAGIAAHIVNNVSAYGIAALTGSVSALRSVREMGWLESGVQVAGFAVFALAAFLIARRMRLRRTVDLSQPH